MNCAGRETILNIAGGKLKPIEDRVLAIPKKFLVNLDTSYMMSLNPQYVEESWVYWNKPQDKPIEDFEYFVNMDIYEFLSRTIMKFDVITIYRFLEHVPFDKVLFFIYLLSTVTEPDATIDVIVPDYEILAEMILQENVNARSFESHNIILTTELLNEPSCPHASIWTGDRIEKFFRMEKRFKTVDILPYKFDGRDIYLRAIIKRI
jgi:hypothetical protein